MLKLPIERLTRSLQRLLQYDPPHHRQTLRWLMHDYDAASPAVAETLARALQADDWEVRATALLAVGRLRVGDLGKAIRRVQAYPAHGQGLDRRDLDLLKALPKVVATLLAGEPIPDPPSLPLSDPQAMRVHIWRCAAGLAVEQHERVFLLLHALTTPLPLVTPPVDLPPAVRQTEDGGYQLARSRLPLAWVPPGPHWLGSGAPPSPIANPIRQETPPEGFFIGVRLLAGGDGAYFDEALHLCAQLAQEEGSAVRLPYADEWEMAARGADGRRYPTGNGFEANMQTRPSPYGMHNVMVPQWALLADHAVACGDRAGSCVIRYLPPPDTRLGVRIVISATDSVTAESAGRAADSSETICGVAQS